MESLPNEVLEILLLKSAVAIYADSKRATPLDDATGSTLNVLMSVRGIAQLNGFLFVIGASPTSEIRVFDASPPHRQLADITVPGLSSPRDVVGCPESGRLYVADWNVADYHSGHCIWRVDVGPPASAAGRSNLIVGPHVPLSLSVTSRRLLVTPYDGRQPLAIIDAEGRLSAQIRLPYWMRPLHATETRRRTVIVCNRPSNDDCQQPDVKVVEVDADGNLLVVCGSNCSQQPQQLQVPLIWPCYAAVDGDGNRVLIADRYGRRVIVLDERLNAQRVLLNELKAQPYKLSYCQRSKRLVVGFYEPKGVEVFSLK